MSSDVDLDGQDGSRTLGTTDRAGVLFSHPCQVQLLEALERNSTQTVSSLSSELVARTADGAESPDDPLSDDHRAMQIELVHKHLPQLTDHGIVEWDRDTGMVSLAANASTDEVDDGDVTAETDVGSVTLTHPTRVDTLSIVETESRLSLEELADHLANDDESRSRITMALHHSHLPAMADAGVLEYDSITKIVSSR